MNFIEHKFLKMDTVIHIKIVSTNNKDTLNLDMIKAQEIFSIVEKTCSRFDSQSELMRLCSNYGQWTPVSPLLLRAISFCLEMSALTLGAFDPTVGRKMQINGFDRHYLSGECINSYSCDVNTTYKDILIDEKQCAVLLKKPLILDLGACAKGLAIDLAANALRAHEGFVIDAGGDIYAHGRDEFKQLWKIGILNPFREEELVGMLEINDLSVCTSGSYERVSSKFERTHHLVDPSTKSSPQEMVSASIISPHAILSDAISTAVFVMGIEKALTFCKSHDIEGIFIHFDGQIYQTENVRGFIRV